MTYHESFWLATGAAAPVIALAAVVALSDALQTERDAKSPYGIWAASWGTATVTSMISILNVIVQAALLAVSLSALAYGQNVMPPWVAIVLAVGGILLLGWTLAIGAAIRRKLGELEKRFKRVEKEK